MTRTFEVDFGRNQYLPQAWFLQLPVCAVLGPCIAHDHSLTRTADRSSANKSVGVPVKQDAVVPPHRRYSEHTVGKACYMHLYVPYCHSYEPGTIDKIDDDRPCLGVRHCHHTKQHGPYFAWSSQTNSALGSNSASPWKSVAAPPLAR